MVDGLEGGSDLGQQSVVSDMGIPAQAQEKMLPQSKVNEIVQERLRQKENVLRQQHEKERAEWQSSQQSQSSMGGMNELSPESIQQMIEQATKKQQERLTQEWLVHNQAQQDENTVKSFVSKLQGASDKYADFDTKVAALQLDKIPNMVRLADEVENTQDVMYDLAENPAKLGNILALANDPNTYHLAKIAMQRLSDSIKQNESAQNVRHASNPLKPVRPSLSGTDNGSNGVSGQRKQPWLRA
jgi:hypothetical protein